MAEVGEPLAKMLTSTSSTNETNNEANNEANNGVVISLASHRWNKDTCAWTDMNTNHSSVRSDPPFLHGSPDDIKESFVCFTKPNLHSSELLWHVDHFLELRRMTASHGTHTRNNVNRDDVILSPAVETKSGHRWRVALFPNGTHESKGHVGVYVLVQHKNDTEEDLTLTLRGARPSRDRSVTRLLNGAMGHSQAALQKKSKTGKPASLSASSSSSSTSAQNTYQQWQAALRSWPRSEKQRISSLPVKTLNKSSSFTALLKAQRYYMKFSLTIIDMEGAEVPGTRVQQSIQSAESGSFWGFPKYLTVLDEADLLRFMRALGGCLRLHVTVDFCDAIRSSLPGVCAPAVRSEVSHNKSFHHSPNTRASTNASSQESLFTRSSSSTSLQDRTGFLDQLREALLFYPEELFDLDIWVGQNVRLKANRLILTTRCPVLINDVLEFPDRNNITPVARWPYDDEDAEVVSALLQYIHFDSCDLITEVNPWDAKTQIQLKRLKEVASQLNLTYVEKMLSKAFENAQQQTKA